MKREYRVRGKMLVQAFEPFTMESVCAETEDEALARATSAGLVEIEWAKEVRVPGASADLVGLPRSPALVPAPAQ